METIDKFVENKSSPISVLNKCRGELTSDTNGDVVSK